VGKEVKIVTGLLLGISLLTSVESFDGGKLRGVIVGFLVRIIIEGGLDGVIAGSTLGVGRVVENIVGVMVGGKLDSAFVGVSEGSDRIVETMVGLMVVGKLDGAIVGASVGPN